MPRLYGIIISSLLGVLTVCGLGVWRGQAKIRDDVAEIRTEIAATRILAAVATTEREALRSDISKVEVDSAKVHGKLETIQRAVAKIETNVRWMVKKANGGNTPEGG